MERMKRLIPLALLLTSMACGGDDARTIAIRTVGQALTSNPTRIAILASDLRADPNPYGKGMLVYHPQTNFNGTGHLFVWLVLDGVAHPLNGGSKDVTPSLNWPREMPEAAWRPTGLDPASPKKAIALVFPGR